MHLKGDSTTKIVLSVKGLCRFCGLSQIYIFIDISARTNQNNFSPPRPRFPCLSCSYSALLWRQLQMLTLLQMLILLLISQCLIFKIQKTRIFQELWTSPVLLLVLMVLGASQRYCILYTVHCTLYIQIVRKVSSTNIQNNPLCKLLLNDSFNVLK